MKIMISANSSWNIYNFRIPLIKALSKNNEIIIVTNKDQYTEIKDIQWFTEKEVVEHIRDYNKTKKELISKFFKFIKEHENLVMIE